MSATLALAAQRGGIFFLDPPYDTEQEYRAALEQLAAEPPSLVIVQHSKHFALEESYGGLRRTRMVKQSDNVLSFYAPA
jgi:16S rRNA G966 N2-methylase RsmD